MMQKTRINLDILLPEVPDERDECVNRIINTLHFRRGIDKIHVGPSSGVSKAQLCFHYDPEVISINEVERLAGKTGIAITDHYGHLLIDVAGIGQHDEQRADALGVSQVMVALTHERKMAGAFCVAVTG